MLGRDPAMRPSFSQIIGMRDAFLMTVDLAWLFDVDTLIHVPKKSVSFFHEGSVNTISDFISRGGVASGCCSCAALLPLRAWRRAGEVPCRVAVLWRAAAAAGMVTSRGRSASGCCLSRSCCCGGHDVGPGTSCVSLMRLHFLDQAACSSSTPAAASLARCSTKCRGGHLTKWGSTVGFRDHVRPCPPVRLGRPVGVGLRCVLAATCIVLSYFSSVSSILIFFKARGNARAFY